MANEERSIGVEIDPVKASGRTWSGPSRSGCTFQRLLAVTSQAHAWRKHGARKLAYGKPSLAAHVAAIGPIDPVNVAVLTSAVIRGRCAIRLAGLRQQTNTNRHCQIRHIFASEICDVGIQRGLMHTISSER